MRCSISEQSALEMNDVLSEVFYAQELFSLESRGHGDVADAYKRLARSTSVTEWQLRRRVNNKIKTPNPTVEMRLRRAYLAVCKRWLARMQLNVEREEARGHSDDSLRSIKDQLAAIEAQMGSMEDT